MKKVYLTLCLLALMVLSVSYTPAFAANWYYVGNSNNGRESVYIDNSSVIKNNRRAIVWVKWITSENTKSLQRVYYTRRPKTFTILSFTTYDADGNVIDNVDIPSYAQRSRAIRPGTMGESIWYCIWPY